LANATSSILVVDSVESVNGI